MKDACAVGTLTLIFGLLSTLQGVSTNEVSQSSVTLGGPYGQRLIPGHGDWREEESETHCVEQFLSRD